MTNSHKKQQLGLSLVELMIAIAIGAFLTLGLTEIFSNSKQTYRVQENLSRLQENARFAIQIISRDIRMADYAGCKNSSVSEATNHIDTTSTPPYIPALHDFTSGIDGINGAAGASVALDASDTLILLNAADSGASVQPPFGPLPSSDIAVTAGHGFEQGDMILIADCKQSDIFQITNDPAAGTAIQHALGAFTSNPGPNQVNEPGNVNSLACAGGHCLSRVYTGEASLYTLRLNTYDIQPGTNGLNALFRNNQELVEGIENMQVLYGEDSNNDNTPDSYVPAGTAGLTMDNVVSIRVSLLASTIDDNVATQAVPYTIFGNTVVSPTNDRRIRRVFTSTIALRNRLP
jgi:type IV pilus assembly protein PilW